IMGKTHLAGSFAGVFLNQSQPNNYVGIGGGTGANLRIVDGLQGANKVLKSDASGNASWADISTLPGGLSGGTVNYIPKWSSATSLSSTSLIFDNGTNVGIGTSSPATKLHVVGSSIISNSTVIDPDNYTNQTISGSIADGSGWQINSSVGGNSGTGDSWAIGHNGTSLFFGMQNGTAANTMQTYMQFDGNRNLILNPTSGFVGIGTTNPIYNLDVLSSTSAYAGHFVNSGTGGGDGLRVDVQTPATVTGTRYGLYSYMTGGLSAQYAIYGHSNTTGTFNYGVYGIANNGTSGNWAVLGSSSAIAGNYGVYCSGNGGYTGTWVQVSDVKFKENINPYKGALNKVMQLEPKTYTMKTKEFSTMNFAEGTQIGFIAQDMEKILPELVIDGLHPATIDEKTEEPIGDGIKYKGINYIALTPVLVQAIKEQQQQIEELKKLIEEQNKRIQQLERK
ncbi:MAG: tail fiber domain-containing protein, partial [Bacteroidota bacterium]